MKKLLIILSLLFTIIFAGVLQVKHVQRGKIGTVAVDQVYMNQFPEPMPGYIFLNPTASFLLR